MITDQEIRVTGIQRLIETMGEVNAERFIALLRRDDFNYTEWRTDNLPNHLSVRQISQQAQNYHQNQLVVN